MNIFKTDYYFISAAGEKSDTEGAKLPPIRALQIAMLQH
jgi:hypothetical protein